MSSSQAHESGLFVRAEDGRGFRPTKRGAVLLRVWDVLSWIVVLVVLTTWVMQGSVPIWMIVLVVPFAIAPFLAAMFFSGRGPLGALVHYARRTGGKS